MDTKSSIFQNLNGASDEISLFAENDEIYVYNNITESIPVIIHGNGPTKVKIYIFFFNLFIQYLNWICRWSLTDLEII